MACDLFRSCRSVSLISQASIQSSIAFLDFIGVNGQNTSLSIITFQFDPLNNGSKINGSASREVDEYLARKCSLSNEDTNEISESKE
jgi:hypothetical protein